MKLNPAFILAPEKKRGNIDYSIGFYVINVFRIGGGLGQAGLEPATNGL